MSPKTRRFVTWLFLCVSLVFAVHGQEVISECTSAEISNCSQIVNFTLLGQANYTRTRSFCGDGYIRFKSCMEPLRDFCSPVVLSLLDDLISTLRFICDPEQLLLLQEKTSCLTQSYVTSHIAECQTTFKNSLGKSDSVGSICRQMVDFLSCSRWTAWASCGHDAAEYVYRIQSHWVNMTVGTLGCTTSSREAPSGVLWSYVIKGYDLWNPSTSTIMQLTGDPEIWVPTYLESGEVGRRYISSNSATRFGYLAADYWHNKLLWVDLSGATAHYAPIYFFEKESVSSTLVFGGMSKNVTSIAVDWVSQNLYWTDAGYNWIGLVPYKEGHMGHHLILFDKDLQRPSGIITDPAKGLLYWTDVEKGVIERSSLSGTNRILLQNGLDMPTSLAIDYGTSHLYWLGRDRHTIYSSDTAGGSVREIRKEGYSVIYNDISVYEDYIFVTVNKADLIIYNKKNGTKLDQVGLVTNRNYEETYAVTVSAPSKQQPVNNRCYYDNGGCSQVCIISNESPEGVVCRCTIGYNLASDKKNCVSELFYDNFIIIADSYGNDLYMISLENGSLASIPIDPGSIPQAVEYIPDERSILWYEETSNSLRRTTLNNLRTRTVHYFGSAVVRGIAYDRVKNNLYFSDAKSGRIKYVSLMDGYSSETIVVYSDIPADIVLDINERVIYWTEWRAIFSSPGIYRANMDSGTNKVKLVSLGLYYPSGLNINFKDRLMFWCDAYTDTIESYDLLNEERRVLVNITGSTFYSMAMDDKSLYASDLSSRNLLRYDFNTSSYQSFGPRAFQKAVSLRLYRARLEDFGSSKATSTTTTRSKATEYHSTNATGFMWSSAISSTHATPTTTSPATSPSSLTTSSSVSSSTSTASPTKHQTRVQTTSKSSSTRAISHTTDTSSGVKQTPGGASNGPEVAPVSERKRLTNGAIVGIVLVVVVIVAVMITISILLYKRNSQFGAIFFSRLFSNRRLHESDDVINIDMDRGSNSEA